MGCCYSCYDKQDSVERSKASRWKPLQKRSCTDVIPLGVFLLFFLGMVIIGVFSIANGAAARLINGYDSYGNICNQLNKNITNHSYSGLDLRGKKFVFFMNVLDPHHSLHICVSKCPNRTLSSMEDVYNFYQQTRSQLCDYGLPPTKYLTNDATNQKTGPCPVFPVTSSSPVIFRCTPDNLPSFLLDLITYINNIDPVNRILGDLYMCRYAIIGLCFLAMLVSFITVLLIRYLASVVVYIINILIVVASIVGTGLLWFMYASAKFDLDIAPFNITIASEAENSDAFLWYSIIATIVTVVLLLIILVMRKRVALTVDLFYEAGRCMVHVPFLLLQPLFTFIILLLFWFCWVAVFIFLETTGVPYMENARRGWVTYNETTLVIYMRWYHIVGLFWITEFILACQQITVAGAVAKYYFTRDKNKLGNPILSSIETLLANHIGTCALGSFIITLVKIPRCILMYIHHQIRDSENVIAKLLVKCCIVCLCILEKCLRYINYNAYSLVAINGTNFCKSACDAVATLASNALRVIAINSVGTFVLFLGKLLVVSLVAGIGGVLIFHFHPNVHYAAVPVGVIAVFSYLIAHCFLSIYDMAIDTLLLCFCEDVRVNDGMPGSEYFMPKSLMMYVKSSSRHLNTLEGKHVSKEGEKLNKDTSV